MYPQVLRSVADILNKEFAMLQGTATKDGSAPPRLDRLALHLRNKAIPSLTWEYPANVVLPALVGEAPSPIPLFLHRKVEAAKKLEREVAPLSVYEKAAAIYRCTLQEFIDAWINAGSNAEKWIDENPRLNASLTKTVVNIRLVRGTFEFDIPRSKDFSPIQVARREAIALFARVMVLQDDESARIGRCEYCRRYYVNKRGRKDSRFCPAPRNCGRYYTATQAVLKKAKEERDQKIEILQRALQSWSSTKGAKREYLAKRTGLSKTFITRALKHDLRGKTKKGR